MTAATSGAAGAPLAATPLVVTLGCRLNALESTLVGAAAGAAGLADAVIVNTCAVTGEAVRQARQTIRRLARQHPGRPIVVTGCAAQLSPATFAAMPEVTRILGNAEKLDARHFSSDRRIAVGDIGAMPPMLPAMGAALAGAGGRARAHVQVQQGCDHRCTFCIVPATRGRNRSRPVAVIVAEVAALAAAGVPEVVLTGIDIASYGHDQADHLRLGGLVATLLAAVPALPRLRLSTLDPAAIDDALIAAFADQPRLMPHAHLSLQAADDLVLKRMRRRHDAAGAARTIDRLRAARPDIALGADLIAGFPTESEPMAATTLEAVAAFGLVWLHVFPYSPRAGTPAARMPQVPASARRARAQALRQAGQAAKARYLAGRIGARVDVVVEAPGIGRAPDYASVVFADTTLAAGTIVPVRVTGSDDERLIASVAAEGRAGG